MFSLKTVKLVQKLLWQVHFHSKNKIQVDVHCTCASIMYMCISRLFLFSDPWTFADWLTHLYGLG